MCVCVCVCVCVCGFADYCFVDFASASHLCAFKAVVEAGVCGECVCVCVCACVSICV